MTPEGKVKEMVKKLFRHHGVYFHMPVMNGMGAPTLDFIACANGAFIAVETKGPGKLATPRQEITMAAIRAAGGHAFVVDGQESLDLLDIYIISVLG